MDKEHLFNLQRMWVMYGDEISCIEYCEECNIWWEHYKPTVFAYQNQHYVNEANLAKKELSEIITTGFTNYSLGVYASQLPLLEAGRAPDVQPHKKEVIEEVEDSNGNTKPTPFITAFYQNKILIKDGKRCQCSKQSAVLKTLKRTHRMKLQVIKKVSHRILLVEMTRTLRKEHLVARLIGKGTRFKLDPRFYPMLQMKGGRYLIYTTGKTQHINYDNSVLVKYKREKHLQMFSHSKKDSLDIQHKRVIVPTHGMTVKHPTKGTTVQTAYCMDTDQWIILASREAYRPGTWSMCVFTQHGISRVKWAQRDTDVTFDTGWKQEFEQIELTRKQINGLTRAQGINISLMEDHLTIRTATLPQLQAHILKRQEMVYSRITDDRYDQKSFYNRTARSIVPDNLVMLKDLVLFHPTPTTQASRGMIEIMRSVSAIKMTERSH